MIILNLLVARKKRSGIPEDDNVNAMNECESRAF